jgi:hypothetical protein
MTTTRVSQSTRARRTAGRSALALALALSAACSSAPSEDARTRATSAAFTFPHQLPLPLATLVDTRVQSFKSLPGSASIVYVLRNDGTLWQETGSAASELQIDATVKDYQALDARITYVLGTDGNLWRETGPMLGPTTPPQRVWVAGGVTAFQVTADGAEWVYFLDASENLYLVPGRGASAHLLVSSIVSFQWTSDAGFANPTLYVLHSSGDLWRAMPYFETGGPIDSNVSSFRALDSNSVFVERNGASLFFDDNTSANQTFLDANVGFFRPVDSATMFVVDTGSQLWREEYGSRNRESLADNVRGFEPLGQDLAYVLHADGSLYLQYFSVPACDYTFAAPVCSPSARDQGFDFVAAWGVANTGAGCPAIQSASGAWNQMVTGPSGVGVVPNDGAAGAVTPSCGALNLPSNCCLYVWQPSAATPLAMQDPSVLCPAGGAHIAAFVQCGSNYPYGLRNGTPNDGQCATCEPGQGSITIAQPSTP